MTLAELQEELLSLQNAVIDDYVSQILMVILKDEMHLLPDDRPFYTVESGTTPIFKRITLNPVFSKVKKKDFEDTFAIIIAAKIADVNTQIAHIEYCEEVRSRLNALKDLNGALSLEGSIQISNPAKVYDYICASHDTPFLVRLEQYDTQFFNLQKNKNKNEDTKKKAYKILMKRMIQKIDVDAEFTGSMRDALLEDYL